MAGQGPAPKAPEERASYKVPERGDWMTLPPLARPVLPALPRRTKAQGRWSVRTLRVWAAWRKDWATGSYGPADIAMAVELAYLYEDCVRERNSKRWNEVRQWMDRLALTMKGKRDLRLRLEAASEASEKPAGKARTTRLRLVDEAV